MAQGSGLAHRGLLLLGFLLILITLVGFILLRPGQAPPPQADPKRPEFLALGVPNPGAAFPGHVNWGALAMLGQVLPSAQGWQIRYNATLSLCRHGSAKVPFDILAEMLDEDLQMRNWRVILADGQNIADEQAARRTVLNALKALGEWHKHKEAVAAVGTSDPGLQRVWVAVDRLTHGDNELVREEADAVKKKRDTGAW
jgi:hypothetical protein